MKKTFACAITACLGFCTIALAACGDGTIGKTDEELFNEAKQQFSNYTLEVTIGDLADTSLMIDNGKAKYTISNNYGSSVTYFKEDNGSIYRLNDMTEKWEETHGSTLEEATDNYATYVSAFSAFQSLYYDDLVKQDDHYTLTDNALDSFSSIIGYELSSCKIKLDKGRFTSAKVIAEVSSERIEVSYTFKDYGKTTVTLPA